MSRKHPNQWPLGVCSSNERGLKLWLRLKLFFITIFIVLLAGGRGRAVESGDVAVVVYNRNVPESKTIAEHYAEKRRVPPGQVLAFDLPATESISRQDFRTRLQEPLLHELESRGLVVFTDQGGADAGSKTNRLILPSSAKVRYAVLCYGVPLIVAADSSLQEPGAEKVQAPLRRNEAAVDSELALLPAFRNKLALTGPLANRIYNITNGAAISPTNGLLMVARLDGPSATIARDLVDKALEAERNGLWGRAYFDARGITNGSYKLGDEWIRKSAEIARHAGFETILNNEPQTFPPNFPLSHAGLYAGWYDASVSGPFARPQVEFMPGAVAYHLHSFSAATLRSTNSHWAGPLLDRGAAATMGCVAEPYLEGTPDLAAFFLRFVLLGFSFGEAAYASQNALSWQTTVVGDPLYRPFEKHPTRLHAELESRRSSLIEWSVLRAINQNMVLGDLAAQYIEFLRRIDLTPQSPVLLEKLGDLERAAGQLPKAIESWNSALERASSKPQQARLAVQLAEAYEKAGRTSEAFQMYERTVKQWADFSDPASIYKKLAALAATLGRHADKQQFEIEIERRAAKSK